MIFETKTFAVRDVSAFELSWNKNIGTSKVRPFNAISFRVKGDAEYTVENEKFKAKSGDIVLVPAFYQYHLCGIDEELFVIHFYTDVSILDKIMVITPETSSVYRHFFEEIVRVWTKKDVGYEYECISILYKILSYVEKENRKPEKSKYNQIKEAIDYMHLHFNERELSVGKLSEMCFMSETYFRRLFDEVKGCSPVVYINKLRLDYAVELLKTRYYSVSEVADMCGFSSAYYFSSFIKNGTGHSPSEYIK